MATFPTSYAFDTSDDAGRTPADTPISEVVFLADNVADLPELLAAMQPGVEAVVLDSSGDGLAQMAAHLAGRSGLAAIHVVTHGADARVQLGALWLEGANVPEHAGALARIGAALASGGDLLLYGCDLGAGEAGAAFVQALAQATGADVAASVDATGAAALGGDWDLEQRSGPIEADVFAPTGYASLLAAPTTEGFDGVTLTNGHSLGTAGQPRSINGWTFTMLGADGNPDVSVNAYIDVTNVASETSLADDGTDAAGLLSGNYVPGTGQAAAVLAATTGEEFAFQSIVVEQYQSLGADYRLVGYRNGSPVSGATQDFTAGSYPNGGTLVSVSGSAWQNLDEVRIVRQNGATDISIYVDDITVSAIVRPTATVVVSDSALLAGETSLVTFTFSQAVTGFTNADLTIANGTLTNVSSSNGGVTWTATFTPTAGINDATNLITLNMAGVSTVGSSIAGTGTQSSNNYAINTVRPTATLVVADSALSIGETSGVTITFSEAVTGFTNADLSIANGTLSAVSSSDGGVTWTATFTPSASITDATNLITLDNTGVTNAAGNAGSGTTNSNNYAIDTVRPTATLVMADSTLAIGETSGVTITFSEAVTGFTNADLSIENGTLSNVASSDGGITWTATFTPTASTSDATNLITLDNTGVVDAAGNAGSGSTDSNNYAIDTVRPTASVVVSDTSLLAGETSLVTITFSEAVTGFTNADLSIANGTLSNVSSGDGGITWTATLTPSASTSDATNIITLDNTGVTDAAGNAGSGSTNSNNYAIDTVRPTASIVMADTALAIGETSLVIITFSEAVTGFTNADLTIANGTLSAVSSGDGGTTWTATFTPTASITDATNVITLDNTGVTNGAGNTGSGSTDSDNYAIDTVRPTASIVVSDTSLRIGETSGVTITFSEAVAGFTNADLSIENGTLSSVSSADGGITWTATFTPSASTSDATNLITLDNTGVVDAAGNAGSGSTDSNNYAIDTVRPTATLVVADSTLTVGETSGVTITFSEAVTGFTNADLSIANGTLSNVSSSDGGITWTATFTPSASTSDATNVITLDNTGVVDAAGNAGTGTTDSNNYAVQTAGPTVGVVVSDTALGIGETSLVTFTFSEAVNGFTNGDLTVDNGTLSNVASSDGGLTWTATLTPAAGVTDATNLVSVDMTGVSSVATSNTGSGTTDSNNYAIDTVRPTAALVVADTALRIGETSGVTITFSEAVTGFTNADLSIENGTLSSVSSADGGITWTATFTPSASTNDATNLITLDNTGVTDAAGNAGSGSTDSNNYAIDTVRPTATLVMADSTVAIGETSGLTITFSEAVSGFTVADLSIASGTMSNLSSADGGITWTATFTPSASTSDATNVITLDNTGVTDLAGNAGSGSTDSGNYAVDTVRPTLASAITISDTALRIGDTATVTFTFAEAVTGFTTADVTAPGGSLSNLSSSDGGITWTATLTPSASIEDATNVLALDLSGVTDLAGNAGSGTPNSGNYAVDTARPALATGITISDTALRIGDTATVTFTFGEAVSGFTPADVSVASGTLTNLTSSNGGITWTATLTPSASTADATNVLTLNLAGVMDQSGNAGSGSVDSGNYAVDTLRPTATVTLSDTALIPGDTALVTITFSEAVTGFTNADLTVPNGTLTSVGSSDGGITWTATFTPTDQLLDTSNVITLDRSGVSDLAGNSGTGSTDSDNFTIDTTDNVAPAFTGAVANGSSVVLSYTDANTLNAVNIADASAFAVTSAGAAVTVTAVSVDASARTVTLTLAAPVLLGEAVTVAYTDPTGGNDANATQDAAGNDAVSFGPVAVSNITPLDVAPPTAVLAVDDADLAAGESTTVTITFNEPVADLDLADLVADNATLSNLVQLTDRSWRADLTPKVNVNDASNSVVLTGAGVHDRTGNAGAGNVASNNYAIRTLDPAVSLSLGDSLLTVGETTTLTVHFSSAVSGLDAGDFSVMGGAISAPSSSDGGLTWLATFTPAAGYSGSNQLIALNHAGFLTQQGVPGTGTSQSGYYRIDTQAPTLAISADASLLRAGQSSVITFAFSEAPVGFDASDIAVTGGTLENLAAGADPRVYTARFTPSAASSTLVVAAGSYGDAVGNAGAGVSAAGPAFDGVAPNFDPIGSSPVDDSQAVAINATLVLQFDEPLSAATSDLSGVSLHRFGVSGDLGTVAANVFINAFGHLVVDPGSDLAFESGYAIAWSAGSLKDAAGNAAAAATLGSGYTFKTVLAPTVDGVVVDTEVKVNPDGSSTVVQEVTPVDDGRDEDSSTTNPNLADIVLARDGDGQALLGIGLPDGIGVRSEGTSGGTQTLREQLVNAVTTHEPDAGALPGLVSQGIDGYLQGLDGSTLVTLRTMILTVGAGGTGGGSGAVAIAGPSDAGAVQSSGHVALVIDTTRLPGGTILQLDNVDFAAVVGAATLRGGDGRNYVVGDAARQNIFLGADDDVLRGGGGDDHIGSRGGDDQLYGDEGNDIVVGSEGNDTLEGGAGNDVLQGGMSDAGTWAFQVDAQGRLLSRFTTADTLFGGPATLTQIGAWGPAGAAPDSDDRLAYSYQSVERLENVALLYRAVAGQLPTLNELNAYSTSALGDRQLAQAAFDHYQATHAALQGQAIELQVKALIETVWGAGSSSDALVAMGTAHLAAGGSWADALLYLARDGHSTQRVTDAEGRLNLTLPYVTSELGWSTEAGNDVLRGGDGNDRLVGGGGSDWLDGGSGIDTAVFTGSLFDYHFHKATVNGVAQVVMQANTGIDVDTLVGIERWEIGSKTYAVGAGFAALADNVERPLSDFFVELVGQAALAGTDGSGG